MVKMKNGEGGGASFGGEYFEPDAKGVVKVPAEAVAALRAHGFEIAKDEVEKTDSTDLVEAVKAAKKALKEDPENAEKKAAVDLAVEALKAAKKG